MGFLGRFIFILFWLDLLSVGFSISRLGFFSIAMICLLAALSGGFLMRQGGLGALMGLAGNTRLDRTLMTDSIAVFVAGALLVFPGFISDIIAVALLIPVLRDGVLSWLSAQDPIQTEHSSYSSQNTDVIDVEYTVVEEKTTDLPKP